MRRVEFVVSAVRRLDRRLRDKDGRGPTRLQSVKGLVGLAIGFPHTENHTCELTVVSSLHFSYDRPP